MSAAIEAPSEPTPKRFITPEERRIAAARQNVGEYLRLARDLQAKEYLAKEVQLEEFVAECKKYALDDDTSHLIERASGQSGASFEALIAAGAILAREASDLNLAHNDLAHLEPMHYPDAPTDKPSALEKDVGELAAWLATIIEEPTSKRAAPQDVDKFTYHILVARLNEIAVRCYCISRGWKPILKALPRSAKKKFEDPD